MDFTEITQSFDTGHLPLIIEADFLIIATRNGIILQKLFLNLTFDAQAIVRILLVNGEGLGVNGLNTSLEVNLIASSRY